MACDKTDPLGQDRCFADDRGAALSAPANAQSSWSYPTTDSAVATSCRTIRRSSKACLLWLCVRCLSKHARAGNRSGPGGDGPLDPRHAVGPPLQRLLRRLLLPAAVCVCRGGAPVGATALQRLGRCRRRVGGVGEDHSGDSEARCKRARIPAGRHAGTAAFAAKKSWPGAKPHRLYYCLGLPKDAVLLERVQPALAGARGRAAACPGPKARAGSPSSNTGGATVGVAPGG